MVLVAGWFRVGLLEESLWIDELHTAWVVSDGIEDIHQRGAMGNQAPLYFYLVWPEVKLVGMHEWSLRLPSLLGGLAAVGLITLAAYRWTADVSVSLAAGIMAAIDVDWIFFATEARVYGLVQAIAVVQVVLAVRITEGNRLRDWGALAALVILGFYFHYSTLLFSVCVALGIGLLAANRATRVRLGWASLIVAAACALSIMHLLSIFERRANWAQFISATSLSEWNRWGTALAPLGLLILLSVWQLWRSSATWKSPETTRTILCGITVIGPIALAWLSTATGIAALFFGRYLISAETIIPLLMASMAGSIESKWLRRGGVLIAVIVAVGLRMPHQFQEMRGEDWQTAVASVTQYLEEKPAPTDVAIASGLIETDILQDPDHDILWESYATLPIESIYSIPDFEGDRFGLTYTSPGAATQRLIAESKPDRRMILIVRGDEADADQAAQKLVDAFPDRHYQITKPKTQTARVQWRVLLPESFGDLP